jgi:hypothetical protein
MTIQKKSLITNRAAAKKAIIATHATSTKFSATSAVVAKPALLKPAGKFAKPAFLKSAGKLAKKPAFLKPAPKVGKMVVGKMVAGKMVLGKRID